MCVCVAAKYCEDMVPKVEALMIKKKEISEEDMTKFGKKDPEAYPPQDMYM